MRYFIPLLFVAVLGLVLGAGMMYRIGNFADAALEENVTDNSNVLLEKIRKVYKMVVVEGEFADILDRKEYIGWDLPGLRKRALVKVKAKVSVGYNLENLKIDFDRTNKVMKISNLPEPEILAIDSDINYYDIENGMFNSFTPQELSQINKAAKDTIRANALRSPLMATAREQASEMFGLITQVAQESGWRVEYLNAKPKQTPNEIPSSAPQPVQQIPTSKNGTAPTKNQTTTTPTPKPNAEKPKPSVPKTNEQKSK